MMEGKNLFIGIFTRKRKQINQSHLKPCRWNKQKLKAPSDTTKPSGEPDKSTKAGTLLGGLIDSNEVTVKYDGQMVVSEDLKKIEVMESDSKGNVLFYDMTPLEAA